jgi:hypothetical protein
MSHYQRSLVLMDSGICGHVWDGRESKTPAPIPTTIQAAFEQMFATA